MATWKSLRGWKVRINAAMRCLQYKHFVLVCWSRCPDGDLDFKVSYKGCELSEAAHRVRVDAAEILQNACDQEDAVFEANSLLNN